MSLLRTFQARPEVDLDPAFVNLIPMAKALGSQLQTRSQPLGTLIAAVQGQRERSQETSRNRVRGG